MQKILTLVQQSLQLSYYLEYSFLFHLETYLVNYHTAWQRANLFKDSKSVFLKCCTGLNDIKPQMIEKATINARAVADKFAKDSQSKLGNIRTASQGVFSIDDRDENTPFIKKVRVVTTIDFSLED